MDSLTDLLDDHTLAHIISFLDCCPSEIGAGHIQFIASRVSKHWERAAQIALSRYTDDLYDIHDLSVYRTQLQEIDGLEILKFLHPYGGVYHEGCMHGAIYYNDGYMIDWLHKVAKMPVHTHYSIKALKYCNYAALRWFSDNGYLFGRDQSIGDCMCDKKECKYESYSNKAFIMHRLTFEPNKYDRSHNTSEAIGLLCEFGVKFVYDALNIRVVLRRPDHVAIIKILAMHDLIDDYNNIIVHGNADDIKCLHELGKIDATNVLEIIINDRQNRKDTRDDVLKWLTSINVAIPPDACFSAILSCKPNVLQWLIENGAVCDIEKCLFATNHLCARGSYEVCIEIMQILNRVMKSMIPAQKLS